MCRRRQEGKRKGFLSSVAFFFIPFFLFPRIHQAPLDTCLTGVALISPEGGVPFFSSACHSFTEPFPFPVNLHFKTGDEPIKDGH